MDEHAHNPQGFMVSEAGLLLICGTLTMLCCRTCPQMP